jgi:hypothetical protein
MLNDKRFKEKRGSHLLVNIEENHKALNKIMSNIIPGELHQAGSSLPFYSVVDGREFIPYWYSFEEGLPEESNISPSWRVEQISDPETLLQAYNLWFESFPEMNKNSLSFLDLWQYQASHEKSTFQIHMGYLNDKAVAVSVLYLASHTAVTYCLTTRPEYKDLGICKELIKFNMKRAKELFYPGLGLITNPQVLKSDLLVEDLGFTSIAIKRSA